jgi:rRNA maturation endonuclease Nob1
VIDRKLFCIWKKEILFIITDCKRIIKYFNHFEDFDFCPYCGGKIITEELFNEIVKENIA